MKAGTEPQPARASAGRLGIVAAAGGSLGLPSAGEPPALPFVTWITSQNMCGQVLPGK